MPKAMSGKKIKYLPKKKKTTKAKKVNKRRSSYGK